MLSALPAYRCGPRYSPASVSEAESERILAAASASRTRRELPDLKIEFPAMQACCGTSLRSAILRRTCCRKAIHFHHQHPRHARTSRSTHRHAASAGNSDFSGHHRARSWRYSAQINEAFTPAASPGVLYTTDSGGQYETIRAFPRATGAPACAVVDRFTSRLVSRFGFYLCETRRHG